MLGSASSDIRRARSGFYSVGVAYVFAIITLIAEVISAMLVLLQSSGLLEQSIVIDYITISSLIAAFVCAAIALFVLGKMIVYIVRLFISLFLVWVTLGYIYYVSYSSNSSEMQLASIVSLILFAVITVIFYASVIIQKGMLNLINEYKVSIERLEDHLTRVAPNISRDDAAQLLKFLGGAKRTWSSFIKSTVAGSDVARVFYKSLLVTNIFFMTSLFLSDMGVVDFMSTYGMDVLILLIVFTIVVTILDVTRVEKMRKRIMGRA